MPKPDWLKKQESYNRSMRNARYCSYCDHYGDMVKTTRHNGKELVDVHACSLHPGCFNTIYSLACSDFKRT